MTAELIVANVDAWRRWLSEHGSEPEGVWLVLAKKGTTDPTSLTYDQALAAVTRAKAAGNWDVAYTGSATIEVPHDFAAALAANRQASQAFLQLDATNRYAILYRVTSAHRKDTRARRIAEFVTMLAEGKTIHPLGTR